MISINIIQEALVTKLKSSVALTAKLATASEVREDQYQGRSYSYPCVRIDIGLELPYADCTLAQVPFSVLCYSEKASSFEANDIANVVNQLLHHKPFSGTGIKFVQITSEGVEAAQREDERTWVAVANFNAIFNPLP